jgi:hypothetical protein
MGWPEIFPETPEQQSAYSYTFLVNYKWDDSQSSYNLATSPEDVCITIGAGSMLPLYYVESESARAPIDGELLERLKAYDARGGVVTVQEH